MILSLLVAAVSTVALQDYLARLEAEARAAGPGIPMVVAATNVPRGTLLQSSMLSVEAVPDRYRPPGALSDPQEAIGKTAGSDLVAGDAVTVSRLTPPGGPVASLVPPGLRAVPVTGDLPPGSLTPGDRVDVMATFAGGQPHTETVAGAAEVLRVLPPPIAGEPGTTVVLLVHPELAERLAYARTFADLSMAVASPSDTS
ncbi:MAG TPA: Flp pilus assembly protein CpaB [Actinomycetota bacterium]|nr:Flp pilus assembly protein CpaB [Actinomycetota bacterium]